MSILSKIGALFGRHFRFLLVKVAENKADLSSLKTSTTDLQVEVIKLQQQVNQLQITGSLHSNDITILKPENGLILTSEDYQKYRIRISKENKLIVDNVTLDETHVAEIQLHQSGSSSIPITWDG